MFEAVLGSRAFLEGAGAVKPNQGEPEPEPDLFLYTRNL